MTLFLRLAVPVLLLLAPLSAHADEIYRWTDDEGEVHYTNDPDAVPANKRTKVKVTKGGDLGHVKNVEREQKAKKAAHEEPPLAEIDGKKIEIEPVHPPVVKAEEPGESEPYWRGLFRDVHGRISALERALEEGKKRLEDPAGNGMAIHRDVYGRVYPSPEFENLRRQVAANEEALTRAREELSDLERRASNKAIPREWRR